MIIYKVENKVNGKVYIGKTVRDLSVRIAQHIRDNKYPIQRALNIYGLESFDISVIDHAETDEVLSEKERYWIRTLNCKGPNGYNMKGNIPWNSPRRKEIDHANTQPE